jgi:hypothetical protein
MNYQHKNLASGRWNELSFFEQMANIGSEIERTASWLKKGNSEYGRLAFERALELLDLTISEAKDRARLRELARVREALADHFAFDNSYQSTDESWQRYFYSFAFAARAGR